MAGSRLVAREKETQAAVVELARLRGWLVYHTFDSRRSAGGFPDLVMVRDRVVFAELKRQGGMPRADQRVWLDALAGAGCETYVWTLDDLDEIALVLVRRGRPDWQPASAWLQGRGRRDAA